MINRRSFIPVHFDALPNRLRFTTDRPFATACDGASLRDAHRMVAHPGLQRCLWAPLIPFTFLPKELPFLIRIFSVSLPSLAEGLPTHCLGHTERILVLSVSLPSLAEGLPTHSLGSTVRFFLLRPRWKTLAQPQTS